MWIRGLQLNPNNLTNITKLKPRDTYLLHERGQPDVPRIYETAGWHWESSINSDVEVLLREMLTAFEPSITALRKSLNEDPTTRVKINIFGKSYHSVRKQGTSADDTEMDGSEVNLYLEPDVIKFLYECNATVNFGTNVYLVK